MISAEPRLPRTARSASASPTPAGRIPMAAFDPKDIRLLREPTVYLLGRQTIDPGELDRFLADHSVQKWGTDTEVAGEKLCEISGRLCYLSFARPRPGGNSAYLGHI